MSSSFPTVVNVKKVRSSDGQAFAKIFNLSDDTNMAMFRCKNADGSHAVNLIMEACGVQSVAHISDMSSNHLNIMLDNFPIAAAVTIRSAMENNLRSVPMMMNIIDAAERGLVPSLNRPALAQVHTVDDIELLALRIDGNSSRFVVSDNTKHAIYIVSASTERYFIFSDEKERNRIFEGSKELNEMLSSVAVSQMGSEIIQQAISPSLRRPGP